MIKFRSTTEWTRRVSARWKRWIYAGAFLPLFAAIYSLGFWLRFEGQLDEIHARQLSSTILWVVLIKLFVFRWLRVDQGWTRFVTFHDLVVLCKAATLSSLLIILTSYLVGPASIVPRTVLVLDWGFTVCSFGALRSISRLIEERRLPQVLSRNVLPAFIVGTNRSGEALLRTIRLNHTLPYRVLGFITEHESSVGTNISGVPVLGTIEDTCRLAEKHGISQVLIAAGELPGQRVRTLVEQGRDCGVTVKVLPSFEQLLCGTIDVRPRTVSIEDLLRREPVQLDLAALHRWIDKQVLLVTGSAGSIGSEICRQLLSFNPQQLVVVDRAENGQFHLERKLRELAPEADIAVYVADVLDQARISEIFDRHRPEIVFHAAAYKHVPLMESNPGEAVKNITLATRRLADLAVEHRVGSFVLISTDKAVNPTSVMGVCKRLAELSVQSLAANSVCRFVTVRFGNVLDSAGSVVPIFREQIQRGGPVTVTHPEMRRFFMTIPEASQLVVQAGAMGKGGEIFVLDMGDPIRIVDLARDMIRLSGLREREDIDIQFVGQRPGEKLYEELLFDGERHLETSHPKIMVAESSSAQLPDSAIPNLVAACDGPAKDLLRLLGDLVPQFHLNRNAGTTAPATGPKAEHDGIAEGQIVSFRVPRRVDVRTDSLQLIEVGRPRLRALTREPGGLRIESPLPKNFALIGAAGYIAPRHLQAIRDTGNRLLASVDPHDCVGRMDNFFPDAHYFTEIERFDRFLDLRRRRRPDDQINYVSICSPNYLHDAHARLALRNEAHAICEKPLVISPWNLDALQELEEEHDRRVFPVLQLRLLQSVIDFKEKMNHQVPRDRASVCLTYVTRRGRWYDMSWKGSQEKSGGVAMNIGIHFFDLLMWLFGEAEQSSLHLRTQRKMAGTLELERASVRWFLSTDASDLPGGSLEAGRYAHRSLTYDGQEIDFSDGFTDLHTRVYEEILAGRGLRLQDARPAIELVHKINQVNVDNHGSKIHPPVAPSIPVSRSAAA